MVVLADRDGRRQPSAMKIPRTVAAFVLVAALHPATARSQSTPILERRELRADGHALTVWSKRPPTAARGAILLLHGRTWSALPNFDLHAPGQRVSLMDALVARGYAVYALDARGYGSTLRDDSGWLTPDRAARDASAVLDWVRAREQGGDGGKPRRAPVLLGYSRGSQVALLVAQRHPEKLSGVVLYGFPQDVTKPLAASASTEPAAPPRRRTTATAAGEDFITPDSTPAGVRDAYVRDAIARDSVRVDWRHEEQFAALDPAAVKTPVLVINGERDPYANAASLPIFFSRLRGIDRWWVVLAHADHAAHLERQPAFVNAVASFMERATTER
jgi:pimeloyl-ACP methyl ester carboxylesterase